MGDFHKGRCFDGMPEELVRHIKLHRYIDSLTRTDESFQNSRRCIDPIYRHARGVLVDVFYDYFLACNWEQFSPQPLSLFSATVYRGLEDCYDYLSPGLQRQLPSMIKHNWLLSYQNIDTVQRVLRRLEQRLNGKVALGDGLSQLFLHQNSLESDFILFMKTTLVKVRNWKTLY